MNYIYLSIFFLIIIAYIYVSKTPNKNAKINVKENYKSKYILTVNEYIFYKSLREITDKNNIIICPKVGLKDLFEITNKKNYMKAFSKISQKHIDFLLCDEKLHPIAGIELDDKSHKGREESDNFKNEIFEAGNLKLIRIKAQKEYTPNYIEKYLKESDTIK